MRIIPLFVVLAVIVGTLFLPVQMPWKLTSIGQVFPRKSWKITQDGAGNLLVNETDHRSGQTSATSNYQFERGDLVQAFLKSTASDSTVLVKKGDTVMVIASIVIADRLTSLRGDLAEAEAQLVSGETGQKRQLIEEAENRLRLAEQEFLTQKGLTERARRLLSEGQIAKQEIEISENLYQKAGIEITVAEKNLEDLRTGLKPEDVEVLRSRIKNLSGQIDFLTRQNAKYVIRAPFDGLRRAGDALLGEAFKMQSVGEFFVKIPVRVEDLKWVNSKCIFRLTDSQTGKIWPAELLGFSPSVEVISGQRAVFAETVVRTSGLESLPTGLSMTAEIDCGAVNLREYLRRVLNVQSSPN